MEESVTFTYRVQDNISKPSNEAADAQRQLGAQTEDTTRKTDSQRISFMTQIVAVTALHRGLSNINSGLQELGILSGGAAVFMNKLNSIVQVTAGGFQLFKGAAQIVNMLTKAEIGLATVRTYNAVLSNPARVAVAAAGLAVAGGVAGYLMGGANKGTTVNQQVNFSGQMSQTDQRSIQRDSMEVMGGG